MSLVSPGFLGAADSPKAAAIAVSEALREGDVASFVAGFDADHPKEVAFLTALGGFSATAIKFRNAFVEAYGLIYWNAFQNSEDPPGAHDFTFTNVTEAQMAALQALDADKLLAERKVRLPNTATEQSLVENDGQWLIDASTMLPPNQSIEATTKLISKMTSVVERYTKVIGRPGVQARDIDHDLGLAIHEIQHGPSPEPARIDLQALEAKE